MYQSLIPQIKSKLEDIESVKEVFAFPTPKITKYPAVIFYPSDFSNAYETTTENNKEYRFRLYVVVELKNLSESEAFETVMPKVVDSIIAKFDADWNMGTVEGHRVRALLGSGNWGVIEDKQGKEAYAELTLTIKTLTTN
jgi:hypothetical protein